MSISALKKVCAGVALIAYSSLTLFGLFSLHHHNAPMTDCPYMVGQHSICQMDAIAHLQAWKDVSTSILPMLTILLLTAALTPFLFLWPLSPPRLFCTKQRFTPLCSRLHQKLFSQGILNPKAP